MNNTNDNKKSQRLLFLLGFSFKGKGHPYACLPLYSIIIQLDFTTSFDTPLGIFNELPEFYTIK